MLLLVGWSLTGVTRAEEYCFLKGEARYRLCSENGLWIGSFAYERHASGLALGGAVST